MKTFIFQGLVQFDSEDNKPTICGDRIKWLDVIKVKGFFYRRAETKAFEVFNEKYPEYKGFIQLT